MEESAQTQDKEESLIPWSIRFLRSKKMASSVLISGWIIVYLLLVWSAIEVFNKDFTLVDFIKFGLSSGTILLAIMLFFVLLVVERIDVTKYVERNLDLFMKVKNISDRDFAKNSFKAEVQKAKEITITNTKMNNFTVFVIITTVLNVILIFLGLPSKET